MLPLSEEPRSNGTDDLVRLEEVRVEVMRARGAGGQVRLRMFVLPFIRIDVGVARVIVARQ